MLLAMRRAAGLFAIALVCITSPAKAGGLIEPRLTLPGTAHQQPHIALTLDACSGRSDGRILSTLIDNRIPATVFVTARWLNRNPAALKLLLAHPDLFQIENHGARHMPAVDRPMTIFGIRAAGSAGAVKKEVSGGATAILAATGHVPHWFRGATGKYTASSVALVRAEGEAVAGYSLIADDGAKLGKAATARRIGQARNGDVIIAHMNHPERHAGQGVVAGIMALRAKGFIFVKLGLPGTAGSVHRGS